MTNIEQVRKVTQGHCKVMEFYVSNLEGKIPIFGYPMMSFSPRDNGRTLTDRKTWRIAMLGNGKILKQEDPTDVDYISTTIANAKIKAKKEVSPR